MAKIITLRNQQVILDSDVAELYGVKTKEINQAVSNNPNKFPNGYIFQLDNQEINDLRSKNLTLKDAGRGQHSKYPPKAFTEKGLYMLATILKSPKAVETTIAIVEAYAKLKELSRVIVEVPQYEDKSTEQQVLLHRGGQLIEEIMSDILPKQSSETSFELNLAMFKFKHSVKRENDDEIVSFPKNGPNNGSSTGSETETVEAPTINGTTPFE
ncbi:MAG: ORF6N domain-containing protein [Bacteroidales bacterium]|nr:ORF6N domain-containing protein [Bacteroidales bacterium]